MKELQVEIIEGAELLVGYIYDKQPLRTEECHGYHHFDDSNVIISSVEVLIG